MTTLWHAYHHGHPALRQRLYIFEQKSKSFIDSVRVQPSQNRAPPTVLYMIFSKRPSIMEEKFYQKSTCGSGRKSPKKVHKTENAMKCLMWDEIHKGKKGAWHYFNISE